jgi:hypothetical protein
MQTEQQEVETQPISEPRVSRRGAQFRTRYVKALTNIGVRVQPRALLDVDEEEFVRMQRQIIAAIERVLLGEAPAAPTPARCRRCGASTERPRIEEQIAEFEDWQRRHGEPWIWPASEMQKLAEKLVPGDELEPCFAYSVRIRKQDGTLLLHERRS